MDDYCAARSEITPPLPWPTFPPPFSPVAGGIRIAVGDVMLHLEADTSAVRIAEIVRALGVPL